MNNYSIPPLLSAFIFLFSAFLVLFKNKKTAVDASFIITCFLTFWWQFAWVFLFNTKNPGAAAFLVKMGYAGIILLPTSFYAFTVLFLGMRRLDRIILYVSLGLCVIFELFLLSSNHFINGYYSFYWGYYPKAGLLHIGYLGLLSLLTCRTFYLFYYHLKLNKESDLFRLAQTRYLLLGTVFYVLSSVDFAVNYGLEFYPVGFLFIMCCIGSFAYAMYKYRLLDIRVAVVRVALFVFVYTLTLGIPFYVGLRLHSTGLALVLMGVMASIGPFAYLLLRRKADNILLAEQRRYQKILTQASQGMVKEHVLAKLLKMIVYILKRSVKIKFAAIFLDDKEHHVYRLKAIRDSNTVYPDIAFDYDHPFMVYLKAHRKPFTYAELPDEVKLTIGDILDANLVIPSFMQDRMIGFLILGDKLNGTLYSSDDINVFITLSNQAALAVENCLFMEEFEKSQERLYTSEKMALVGGMADGLAHQLKNRLNQFSMAGGEMALELDEIITNLEALYAKKTELFSKLQYIKQGLDSIKQNVVKTNTMIQGILNFARTERKDTFFSEFSFREVIAQCVDLLMIKHQLKTFPLTTEVPEDDHIFGVKAQIIECIYNTLDNAYEAVVEKHMIRLPEAARASFKPSIKVQLIHADNHHLITIIDNGVGVKEEDRAKVFGPFFTTKPSNKSGSGIGAYVVKRMIDENHKGRIWFKSQYMEGTAFYIKLPCQGSGI